MNSNFVPKSDLRSYVRDLLEKLDPAIKKSNDEAINQNLINFFQGITNSNILSFNPIQREPDIGNFNEYIKKQNRLFWPQIENVFIYPDSSDLAIPELSELRYIIIPALSVTKEGVRLGRGGGWYDRLLENVLAVRVCPLYSFQIIDSIPQFDHDQRVDIIVTESEIIKTNQLEEKTKNKSV